MGLIKLLASTPTAEAHGRVVNTGHYAGEPNHSGGHHDHHTPHKHHAVYTVKADEGPAITWMSDIVQHVRTSSKEHPFTGPGDVYAYMTPGATVAAAKERFQTLHPGRRMKVDLYHPI